MHMLKGLSKENSWNLFEKTAFGLELTNPPEDLVTIGQKIVERCVNVPLAIKVVGSILYGQDKCKWLSFQELPLIKFEENENGIMPILKLSYHQLESPLKSCFGYCALFPKDYVIKKKTLIRLWMAQGYILSNDQQSMEDVAEEYFLVLMWRCFFQDVKKYEYGEIKSCKIHDLMHDVVQEVVGKEICRGNIMVDIVDKKVRHFSTVRRELKSYLFNKTCVRSYLQVYPYCRYVEDGMMDQLVDALLANWKYLRVLDLSNMKIKNLPSSVGKLLHLRYLDLSHNHNLEALPRKITKLYNLETLNIAFCWSLKELPKDMSKLAQLRVLDIRGCMGLSFMPRGMGNLRCLQELTMFVVGEANSSSLEDLKALTNLKGNLYVNIGFRKKDENEEKNGGKEGRYLSNKADLTHLGLSFSKEKCVGRVEILENDEAIIEELQPHSDLKGLDVCYYEGVKMPKWANEDTLANLVKLLIISCFNLESLGCLGTMQHLKSLHLEKLGNLKWLIEKKNTREGISERGVRLIKAEEFSFFPSLESLRLCILPELKGWWREEGLEENHQQMLRLLKLKDLRVNNCLNLTAIVECPAVEDLDLFKFNKKLGIYLATRKKIEEENGVELENLGEATNIPSSSLSCTLISKLRKIRIENLTWFNSQYIDMKAFQGLQSLVISDDNELESLGEGREVLCSCSSSLLSLEITDCSSLRSVCGGLEHLTSLEFLMIKNCPKLRLSEGETVDVNDSGSRMPWESLNHSLRTLKFESLPQLVNLPTWIQYLTVLRTLEIHGCKELKLLPDWLPRVTSLREIRLTDCSEGLKERCQELTAEGWPHIRHISLLEHVDLMFASVISSF